jgi:NADH:ubiquinone oxidoreductase subunit B-like Fe-S oxidoreductase
MMSMIRTGSIGPMALELASCVAQMMQAAAWRYTMETLRRHVPLQPTPVQFRH